ncbi:MAG: RIP metalloprotease [Nitriliruptor sp.]|nr:MAG: RIP metalloprotease [Nitriliruptor sp.]
MSSAAAILAFVAALVLAILIHELGHLLTAKSVGMKADRYFVGFGPTLWSTRRGETEYGVKALPLGGFVSIRGMSPLDERDGPLVDTVFTPKAMREAAERDATVVTTFSDGTPELTVGALSHLEEELAQRGTPSGLRDHILRRTRETAAETETLDGLRRCLKEIVHTEVGGSERLGDLAWRLERGDEGRFYHDRPAWQRALAIFMGPVTHLAIAFLLLFGLYSLLPLPTGEVTTEVAAVIEDTPAEDADLRVGDRLLAVEGQESDDFSVLRDAIRARPDLPTSLAIQRDEARVEIMLTPQAEEDPATGEVVGLAGFAPTPVEERLPPGPAGRRAAVGDELDPFGGVVPLLGASVQGLAAIFSPAGLSNLVTTAFGEQERDPEGVVSVIGIASIAGQTAGAGTAGVYTFVFLLAYLNVFLFIFNLVPLPPFDGGHLAVIGVERAGNLVRRLRGREQDFTVDPRTITAVALPVIGLLLLVVVTSIWLDISDPLRL